MAFRQKLSWSLKGKKKVEKLLLRLARHRDHFTLALSIESCHIGNELDKSVQTLSNHQDMKDTIEWLMPTDYVARHTAISGCVKAGAYSWLLEDPKFVAWRRSEASGILRLCSKLGNDTTALSYTVMEELEKTPKQSGQLVLYHYFDADDPKTLSAASFVRTLLVQLIPADRSGVVAHNLGKKRLEQHAILTDLDELFEFLATAMQILVSPPVIVVDRLDKCTTEEILLYIQGLMERVPETCMFLTSCEDVALFGAQSKFPCIYTPDHIEDSSNNAANCTKATTLKPAVGVYEVKLRFSQVTVSANVCLFQKTIAEHKKHSSSSSRLLNVDHKDDVPTRLRIDTSQRHFFLSLSDIGLPDGRPR
ncbi:unnamed protein product [Somion occarium]|uniref:Nephrocystin 3-like N-terminal domain-containing protein n=1 Tax=Somion occarium TaxID=3059160 RepID=A0ABP1D4J4_9APHY